MTQTRLYPATVQIGPSRHPADQIRDAEAFCRLHLNNAMEKWGMHLEGRQEDYDDSLSLLVAHLWRLAERFDTERNDCFANYARSIIPKRAVDVGPRRLLGRNGVRLSDYHHDELDESLAQRRHDEALTPVESNEDPDRGPDAERLQRERDRQLAWAANVLRCRVPDLAA